MNTQAYIAQTEQTGGFWMSLNELTADYPWLCKRVARIEQDGQTNFPRRSIWAWIVATFIPNTGFGLLGAVIVYVYLLIFLVPLGIAAYSTYAEGAKEEAARIEHGGTREKLSSAYDAGMVAANLVTLHYQKDQSFPESLEQLDFKNPSVASVKSITYATSGADWEGARIFVELNLPKPKDSTLAPQLMLAFSLDDEEDPIWTCTVSGKIANAAMPEPCSSSDEEEAVPEAEPTILEKMLSKLK